jgi:hypothetical protein
MKKMVDFIVKRYKQSIENRALLVLFIYLYIEWWVQINSSYLLGLHFLTDTVGWGIGKC